MNRNIQIAQRKKRIVIILIAVVALLLIAGSIAIVLLKKQLSKKDEVESNLWTDVIETETPGVSQEFISQNSVLPPDARIVAEDIGSVISEQPFSESAELQTEADAYIDLAGRGFTQYPITTTYSENGALIKKKDISESSSEVHPSYQTDYMTQDGAIWAILSVNGRVTANPVSYNSDGYWEVMHIISETGSLAEYDSLSGTFFEIVPKPDEIVMETVGHIDAATLESFAAEVDW